jgi:hypothetical protein
VSELPQWLERVLSHGESVQTAVPEFRPSDRAAVETILRRNFDVLSLDLAGPPIPFHAESALAAAKVLAAACWRVAGDDDQPSLTIIHEPRTPSDHLSADVTLRFLPTVYRRAKARGVDHPVVRELDLLLRRWPFSGVLIDFEGSPTGELDFFGHVGLQQRYAERLLTFGRAGWVPPTGRAREWAELIFGERGRPLPATLKEVMDE